MFEGGKAKRSCFVDLAIEEATPKYATNSPPKFDTKDVSKGKLEVEEDAEGI